MPPSTSPTEAAERQELFQQMTALLAAQGAPINNHIQALMEPLLNGSMSYAEHRAMLEAMIREAEQE